jgi:hypothetical protein
MTTTDIATETNRQHLVRLRDEAEGKGDRARVLLIDQRLSELIASGDEPGTHLVVVIDYTNHKGQRALRKIVPRRIYYGESPWHPGGQYLLNALDVDKRAERTFAMASIHSWRPA